MRRTRSTCMSRCACRWWARCSFTRGASRLKRNRHDDRAIAAGRAGRDRRVRHVVLPRMARPAARAWRSGRFRTQAARPARLSVCRVVRDAAVAGVSRPMGRRPRCRAARRDRADARGLRGGNYRPQDAGRRVRRRAHHPRRYGHPLRRYARQPAAGAERVVVAAHRTGLGPGRCPRLVARHVAADGGRRVSLRRARPVCRARPAARRLALAAHVFRRPAMIARRRWHRAVFLAAGLYNLAWGLFTAIVPQWLFRFADMPDANYPEILACLGMVVGLYGILYLEVARVPERGWLIAAVGLLGKVLGPIGLLHLVWSGRWPPATLVLCATNDFAWWVPFGLYLYDSWSNDADANLRGLWRRWRREEKA